MKSLSPRVNNHNRLTRLTFTLAKSQYWYYLPLTKLRRTRIWSTVQVEKRYADMLTDMATNSEVKQNRGRDSK
jgi:hypothetical protein